MLLPLTPAFQMCGTRSDLSPDALFKCSRCQVVLYCGREHQLAHFDSHKSVCKEIKKNRDVMEKRRHKVCNTPFAYVIEDASANACEVNFVDPYQRIVDTRAYLDAKILLIRALSTIPTRPAIQNALAQAMDLLRLLPADTSAGIRYIIPTFQLLLGQYQDAYDFIKWWATTAQGNYDFSNKDLLNLDIHGADMTEELLDLNNHKVFFASSIAYIKMTLVKGVQEAIVAYELAGQASLPVVVAGSLEDFLAPGGLPKGLEELKQLHTKLKSQLYQAFRQTHADNQHFWGAMLDPTPIIQMPMPMPENFPNGCVSPVKIWIEQSAMVWQNHREDIREIRCQSA